MTDRDDARVKKALQGATFPADRATLLEYAQTREVDPESMQALRSLPGGAYQNMREVVDAVAQEPEGRDNAGGTAHHPTSE